MSPETSRPLQRHCLITVGATARFTQLLTEVLEPSFLGVLIRDGYTCLTLQCGEDYEHISRNILPPLVSQYPSIQLNAFGFVNDLSIEMAKCRAAPGVSRAGVVICHAGTGTILDGMRVSVPLIVVPNPTLKDNHQVELAEEIQRQGYGIWGRLGDISWALEQLPLQLDKTERQFRPHSVGDSLAPKNIDLWHVSSAMLHRYDAEPTGPIGAAKGNGRGPGEVHREEVAQMTMG